MAKDLVTIKVQEGLAQAGFDPGRPDGIKGPKTEAAAWDFLAHMFAADLLSPPLTGPVIAETALATATALVAKQPKASRGVTGLVFHCTAGFNPSDAAGIRKMHMTPGWQGSKNGWSDIGYHYVVLVDGTIEAGRPEEKIGAHVVEANKGTIGIVYVGGVDARGVPKDTRTAEQKESLLALGRALIAKYPKIQWTKGHNDFTNAKACPSFDVQTDPLGALV